MTTSSCKKWIPEISDEKLLELSQRIKPVIRFSRGLKGLFLSPEGIPYYIKPVDLREMAFTWDATPSKKAKGLQEIVAIRTLHSYGYHGLFKPSIAEVIAQIPEEFLDRVVAFEIVDQPETAADFYRDEEMREAFDAGYHTAFTMLYARA